MKPIRVLIVEDELLVAASLRAEFEDDGAFECDVVNTDSAAIEAVRNTSVDAIVMDIHLGGDTDGIELGIRIREFSSVPLLFYTAFADDETAARARDVTQAILVEKPVRTDRLIQIVAHLIEHAEAD